MFQARFDLEEVTSTVKKKRKGESDEWFFCHLFHFHSRKLVLPQQRAFPCKSSQAVISIMYLWASTRENNRGGNFHYRLGGKRDSNATTKIVICNVLYNTVNGIHHVALKNNTINSPVQLGGVTVVNYSNCANTINHCRRYRAVLIAISEDPLIWKDLHQKLNGLCLAERNNAAGDLCGSQILRWWSGNRACHLIVQCKHIKLHNSFWEKRLSNNYRTEEAAVSSTLLVCSKASFQSKSKGSVVIPKGFMSTKTTWSFRCRTTSKM